MTGGRAPSHSRVLLLLRARLCTCVLQNLIRLKDFGKFIHRFVLSVRH